MSRKRMSLAAERQSVTKRRRRPACCKVATRLCPAVRSVTTAPCKANGAHNSVGGCSLAPIVKSTAGRFELEGNSMRRRPWRLACRLAIGSAGGEFGKPSGDQSCHINRRRGCKGGPQECQVGRRACRGIIHGNAPVVCFAGALSIRKPSEDGTSKKDHKRPIGNVTPVTPDCLDLNQSGAGLSGKHDLT